MHLFDRMAVDSTRRTASGYLAVNARVARAGNVQQYLGYEVGKPEMPIVRVFRPDGEVFNKDTLASFAHRPVTLGHPSEAVTADNWKEVARGWSEGEVARDGEFVRLSMLMADADVIRAIEGGTREISMGYGCELIWDAGVSPAGERFDARQTRIRGNHIAVVAKARGGAELRIGDSSMTRPHAGMTLDEAAALPIYDAYRGLYDDGGQPLERVMAIRDMASGGVLGQRSDDAYRQMCIDQANAHRGAQPVNDNSERSAAPQFARDGRPMTALGDHERAYEEMCMRDADAWRR